MGDNLSDGKRHEPRPIPLITGHVGRPSLQQFEALVDEAMAALTEDVRGNHAVIFGVIAEVGAGTAYLALACAGVGHQPHDDGHLHCLPDFHPLFMGEAVIGFEGWPRP